MDKKYTILLADDHSILRAGLRSMLSSLPDFEVIGEVDNGKDAIHSAIKLKPDLLITDISMPGTNGTDAVREIKRRDENIKILVLTMHASENHVHDALTAGADGYMLKEDTHSDLISAIQNILSGKSFLSPGVCSNVVSGYLSGTPTSTKVSTSWDLLTNREKEIIKLIAEGNKNKEIATYLSISVKTVEKHRSNIMKKLDVKNATGLINYAIQNGLVENS
ncbi:MAG: response regulator transcription factor [Gammaproteobacteria bacterium]